MNWLCPKCGSDQIWEVFNNPSAGCMCNDCGFTSDDESVWVMGYDYFSKDIFVWKMISAYTCPRCGHEYLEIFYNNILNPMRCFNCKNGVFYDKLEDTTFRWKELAV